MYTGRQRRHFYPGQNNETDNNKLLINMLDANFSTTELDSPLDSDDSMDRYNKTILSRNIAHKPYQLEDNNPDSIRFNRANHKLNTQLFGAYTGATERAFKPEIERTTTERIYGINYNKPTKQEMNDKAFNFAMRTAKYARFGPDNNSNSTVDNIKKKTDNLMVTKAIRYENRINIPRQKLFMPEGIEVGLRPKFINHDKEECYFRDKYKLEDVPRKITKGKINPGNVINDNIVNNKYFNRTGNDKNQVNTNYVYKENKEFDNSDNRPSITKNNSKRYMSKFDYQESDFNSNNNKKHLDKYSISDLRNTSGLDKRFNKQGEITMYEEREYNPDSRRYDIPARKVKVRHPNDIGSVIYDENEINLGSKYIQPNPKKNYGRSELVFDDGYFKADEVDHSYNRTPAKSDRNNYNLIGRQIGQIDCTMNDYLNPINYNSCMSKDLPVSTKNNRMYNPVIHNNIDQLENINTLRGKEPIANTNSGQMYSIIDSDLGYFQHDTSSDARNNIKNKNNNIRPNKNIEGDYISNPGINNINSRNKYNLPSLYNKTNNFLNNELNLKANKRQMFRTSNNLGPTGNANFKSESPILYNKNEYQRYLYSNSNSRNEQVNTLPRDRKKYQGRLI